MASNALSPAAIKAQMERILTSRDFQASPRLKNFFRFLVEETLAGRASSLKGYTIATTVFERPDNFDAHADPIVRVEAAKLRSRLEHYYYTRGATDPIRISLPKGGYVPEFSPLATQRSTQQAAGQGQAGEPSPPPLPPAPTMKPPTSRSTAASNNASLTRPLGAAFSRSRPLPQYCRRHDPVRSPP